MNTHEIQQLTVRDFLSYGPVGGGVDLRPLNVLIGPNASGKSNLIEAFAVLRATAGDLASLIREGGGISEYVRKAPTSTGVFQVRAALEHPAGLPTTLSYEVVVGNASQRGVVVREVIRS